MIGIDPHKGSHIAAAIDAPEVDLGQVRVRAGDEQLERLLSWAGRWPQRTWAVENAGGLGQLLAQQLIPAGERVLDVPPKLAPRGPAAQHRGHEQERPQRCPLGGHRRPALTGRAAGRG
jgi:hypothetical protein